jgi:crossover junction endodeoxyribonuclease RuvC
MTDNMKFLGIDPGKTGGIAVIDSECNILFTASIPCLPPTKRKAPKKQDNMTLARMLYSNIDNHTVVYSESTHAHPGEGACSSYDFGFNVGSVDGIISGLSQHTTTCPFLFMHVSPMKWKKELELTMTDSTRTERKKASVDKANAIFSTALSRKQDGIAEALLIAYYALCMYNKTQ